MNNENEKVLEVKNLRISFKTNGGTVKAVRGISFSLYKGKTLAIVGESGSGKSVTSKAILGILANNKIIEDGQIIFEGKDLLKISEDEFTKLRGVKISMIFQDPLSSLNPIMRVGKQLTEAMKLKAKASKKQAEKFVKRINDGLKFEKDGYANLINKIAEIKNQNLNLKDSEVKKQFKDSLLNDNDVLKLFNRAYHLNLQKYNKQVNLVLDLANKFYSEAFSEFPYQVESISKNIKPLIKQLKKTSFQFKLDSDDVIEVYPTIVKDLQLAYKESIRLLTNQKKLFEKYNVNNIYDLPASVRAKLREVILSPEERLDELEKVSKELIEHLNGLVQEKTGQEIEILSKQLLEKYIDSVIESKTSLSNNEIKQEALKLLAEVGIPEPEKRYNQYPFEFSGGMRQRIVIAIALSSNPEVLICDEPTTALDVTIQSQILELIQKLKEEKNLSIIFITHDLGVVANMADDIAVMYAGKIVEYGTVFDIFYDPRHPYTWALLGSMPDLKTKEKLNAIPGTPPNMLLPPKGDAFASRNSLAIKEDFEALPPLFKVSPTHYASTWLLHPLAPDVKMPPIVYKRIEESLQASNFKNCPKPDNYKNSVLSYIGGINNGK